MRSLFLVAGILMVVLAVGCAGQQAAGKLAVVSHNMTRDEPGSVKVNIKVKNVGSNVVELARVTVYFYDAQKDLVDSSSDSVMNLRAGETWDFEIAGKETPAGQVKSYEIETMAGTSSGGL